jgi:hypothetical protein
MVVRFDWMVRKGLVAGAIVGLAFAAEAPATEQGLPASEVLPTAEVLATEAPIGERGTLAGVDYEVRHGRGIGSIEVCLAAAGDGTAENALGTIEGSGNGSICVTLTPPPPPESGIQDPFSATVHVGVPTPEGLIEVDVGTFVDTNDLSICVALSVTGEGVEPESAEVCLPPNEGGEPGVPGLPETPGLPGLPQCEGVPELPGTPDLPPELPELGRLPELPGVPGAPGLPGGDDGDGHGGLKTLLAPVFSLLGGEKPEIGNAGLPVDGGLGLAED